jgi:hypothetical protein
MKKGGMWMKRYVMSCVLCVATVIQGAENQHYQYQPQHHPEEQQPPVQAPISKIHVYHSLEIQPQTPPDYLTGWGKARALGFLSMAVGAGVGITAALQRFPAIYQVTRACGLDRGFVDSALGMTGVLFGLGLITREEIAVTARNMAWQFLPISLVFGLLSKRVQDACTRLGLLTIGQWLKDNSFGFATAGTVLAILVAHRLTSPLLKIAERSASRTTRYLLHKYNARRYPYVPPSEFVELRFYMHKSYEPHFKTLFERHPHIPREHLEHLMQKK